MTAGFGEDEIASLSLSSGSVSRDQWARNDAGFGHCEERAGDDAISTRVGGSAI